MAHWFTWTHNNPTEGDIDRHKAIFGKGGVSLERGESGTLHLQGFGRIDKQCRVTALKKLCKVCHFEVKKGSVQSNIEYISKAPLDGPHFWPSITRAWWAATWPTQWARSPALTITAW